MKLIAIFNRDFAVEKLQTVQTILPIERLFFKSIFQLNL